jgi:hypothetical protein
MSLHVDAERMEQSRREQEARAKIRAAQPDPKEAQAKKLTGTVNPSTPPQHRSGQ